MFIWFIPWQPGGGTETPHPHPSIFGYPAESRTGLQSCRFSLVGPTGVGALMAVSLFLVKKVVIKIISFFRDPAGDC